MKYLMALFLVSTSVWAQDDFAFEEITLTGTGCPAGTASITTSPDQRALSIIFDQFSSQVPQTDGQNDNSTPSEDNRGGQRDDKRLSHKICNIVIGARVPEKSKLQGIDIETDYRGAAHADVGASASFRGQLLEWKGPSGALNRPNNVLFLKRWVGPAQDDFTVNAKNTVKVNSGCAARADRKVRLVLKNVLLTQIANNANPASTSASVTMDSSDLGGNLRIKLDLKPCGGRPGHL